MEGIFHYISSRSDGDPCSHLGLGQWEQEKDVKGDCFEMCNSYAPITENLVM